MPRIKKIDRHSHYEDLRRSANELGEKDDCGVKAVAVACDISYEKAHAMLKEEGRKDRNGTAFRFTERVCAKLGKKLVRIHSCDFIDKYPGAHSKLKNVTTHHPRRFNSVWKDGKTYLFLTSGHILAVKDGVVIDWSVNNSLRVVYIYEVVDVKPIAAVKGE